MQRVRFVLVLLLLGQSFNRPAAFPAKHVSENGSNRYRKDATDRTITKLVRIDRPSLNEVDVEPLYKLYDPATEWTYKCDEAGLCNVYMGEPVVLGPDGIWERAKRSVADKGEREKNWTDVLKIISESTNQTALLGAIQAMKKEIASPPPRRSKAAGKNKNNCHGPGPCKILTELPPIDSNERLSKHSGRNKRSEIVSRETILRNWPALTKIMSENVNQTILFDAIESLKRNHSTPLPFEEAVQAIAKELDKVKKRTPEKMPSFDSADSKPDFVFQYQSDAELPEVAYGVDNVDY